MMLIVGLGNPGKKYEKTRHNIGHRVVDAFPQEDGFIVKKTDAFMNDSGKAVKSLYIKYKISRFHRGSSTKSGQNTKYIIAVHDDIDIPVGQFKISFGRGSAGHKGAQSIIEALGTKDFWRARIGICPIAGKPKNVEKFVLEKFNKDEEKIIENIIKEAVCEVAGQFRKSF